jgi:hypothetical protein
VFQKIDGAYRRPLAPVLEDDELAATEDVQLRAVHEENLTAFLRPLAQNLPKTSLHLREVDGR